MPATFKKSFRIHDPSILASALSFLPPRCHPRGSPDNSYPEGVANRSQQTLDPIKFAMRRFISKWDNGMKVDGNSDGRHNIVNVNCLDSLCLCR
ncbi:protein of unknown function [Methylocella tundrae]|uniref:Uncharacterized protein n=1 Tax=Methylocella tundrae TaxID=227605 RepID=A0A4V6IME0_METTU|nr:protein of unknown function [Methylocella tundrae]